MKLNHLLKIFLRNTANPTIKMTEFFQSHHSKVTFPFLQLPLFPPLLFQATFPSPFTTYIFRNMIDLHYKVSWIDSKSRMSVRREIHLPTT